MIMTAGAAPAFAGTITPYGCLPEWRSCFYKNSHEESGHMVSSGMPLIPDIFERAACFLYLDEARAERNARSGGTAFLVGINLPTPSARLGKNVYYPIAVSNGHVAKDGGASVIRFNKSGGGKVILDLTDRDWISHPGGVDLAIAPLFGKVDWFSTEHSFCPMSHVMTLEEASRLRLGIGDEVFMIGRFINIQGTEDYIRPAARFGTISMMPELLEYEGIKERQLSYAVEMRSKKGFSGSPVIVYRTCHTNLSTDEPTRVEFKRLLGINIGFIHDEEAAVGDDTNTWLNGVIPAWFILDILKTDKMKKLLFEADNAGGRRGPAATPASSMPEPSTTADNPSHKEDFNNLLTSAATAKQSDDQT